MHLDCCKGLPLISYIIKPVQRICKYPLLLHELVKYTPTDHPEYTFLQEAEKKFGVVVEQINESKREAERVAQLSAVATKLGCPHLVESGRVIVREGHLDEPVQSVFSKVESFYYVLFNDMLLRAEKRALALLGSERLYQVSLQIPVKELSLVPYDDGVVMKGGLKYCFQIGSRYSGQKPIVVSASSQQEKAEWMADIEQLIAPYRTAQERMEQQKRELVSISPVVSKLSFDSDSDDGDNRPKVRFGTPRQAGEEQHRRRAHRYR